MKKIEIVFTKIYTAITKYKFKRRLSRTTTLALISVILTELIFTGMTFEKDCTVYVTADSGVVKIAVPKSATVADALSEAGIILGEYDRANMPMEAPIENEMNIDVDRIEYVDVSYSEPISYETEYIESSLYGMGTEFVSQEGRPGRRITTYREKLVNGIVVSSEEINVSVREPITEQITVGTAHSEPYSKRLGDFELKGGIPTEYAYIVSGKVTAYTAPPGSGTYSGRPLEIGTVAVNPEVIPFGSELYICSKDGERVYGYAVAADTGDLTEVVADVFMGLTSEHYSDACDWGAQFCDVYVLTVGDNSVSWM